jgi:hypothetical protein
MRLKDLTRVELSFDTKDVNRATLTFSIDEIQVDTEVLLELHARLKKQEADKAECLLMERKRAWEDEDVGNED